MKKVLLLHNQISPHTEGVFQHLAKLTNLEVWYCAESESNRAKWQVKPSGYKYQILQQKKLEIKTKDLFTLFFNLNIFKQLKKINHDLIIIAGWDLPTYWLTAFYCWRKKIPYLVWSGSTIYESSWRRTISKPLVNWILKNAHGYLTYGQRSRDYLLQFGVDPLRIFMVMNGFDFTHYSSLNSKQKFEVSKIQKKYNLNNKTVIIFYGQLIKRKQPDLLLAAFKHLSSKYHDLALLIIGDGDLKDQLIEDANNSSNIIILDNPGDDQIVPYYHLADFLVLPSQEEVWGLVINQAMAAGLPVVASDRVGAVGDLVIEGVTGLVFENNNLSSLADKIKQLFDVKTRTKMSQAGINRAKRADSKQVALRIKSAIDDLLTDSLKKNDLIHWIELPTIVDDCKLTVAQFPQIPFEIKRVYYIYDAIKGLPRGFHAHKKTRQVMFCLKGSMTFTIDDGQHRTKVTLNDPTKGILIDAMIWHQMHDINEDTLMLVLASDVYQPDDYIRDYQSFKERVAKL